MNTPTLPALLERFFTDRLMRQREHHSVLSRHLPAAAGIYPKTIGQAAVISQLGRYRCNACQRISRGSGSQSFD